MARELTEPFRSLTRRCGGELQALCGYPEDRFADIIQEVGFSCNRCARCCTREFNGSVQLLDEDVERLLDYDPVAVEPALPFNFCDQQGTFYVSGYTIRSRRDRSGSCLFLQDGRCRVYDIRPSLCRIYPYMLHREPDEWGRIDWRQISGLNEHGCYHAGISRDEAIRIARETIMVEKAILSHELAFLEFIGGYFFRNQYRHVRKIFDDRMREYGRGSTVRVRVYFNGGFEPWEMSRDHAVRIPE